MKSMFILVLAVLLLSLPAWSLADSDEETLSRYIPFAGEQKKLSGGPSHGERNRSFDDSGRDRRYLPDHMRYEQYRCDHSRIYIVDKESGTEFQLMKINESIRGERPEHGLRRPDCASAVEVSEPSSVLSLLSIENERSTSDSIENQQWTSDSFYPHHEDVVLQSSVDLRSIQSPVKNQGKRNTCTIFASMAAMECKLGTNADLSEQDGYWLVCRHLNRPFDQDKGVFVYDAADTFENAAFCSEQFWSYERSLATTCRPELAVNNAIYRLGSTNRFHAKSPDVHRQVKAMLCKSIPIVACFSVAWDNRVARRTGEISVIYDRQTNAPLDSKSGHSMLIVGYDEEKKHYILKNSWGSNWGDNGYAYMSYEYFDLYAYSTWFAPLSVEIDEASSPAVQWFSESHIGEGVFPFLPETTSNLWNSVYGMN